MQTEIIKEWFEAVPAPHQADIAMFCLTMLEDDFNMVGDSAEAIEQLKNWLTPDGEFPYRTLGKAVSFVAVFENIFAQRFTADGWDMPRELFERVLEKAPNAGMAETAQKGLDGIPEKQKEWAKIGNDWTEAKAKISFEVPVSKIKPPQV